MADLSHEQHSFQSLWKRNYFFNDAICNNTKIGFVLPTLFFFTYAIVYTLLVN